MLVEPKMENCFEHGKHHHLDTGRPWKRRDVPGSGQSRARLLLPEPDQPEHSEGGSILPERLQTVPDLQKLHGAAGTLKENMHQVM